MQEKQNNITKIREAVLDMMSKVVFHDEKNQHIYESQEDGKWLQGVTSVSSIVPKDWMPAWGAKECAKALGYSDYEGDIEIAEQVLEKIRACKTVAEYQAILKEAKGAHARKSKTALVDGKKGHEWLENYVKAKIRGTELPAMPDGMLERPLKKFIAWADENVDTWVLSEARVCNLEKAYAGTMDALAYMKTGKLAVVDFKFASHISQDYWLQTAGYQACFEPYGIVIDERIIVRLPKTLEKDEWDKAKKKYVKVENDIEVHIVATPYAEDRDAFYHALPLKGWINKYGKK